MNKKPTIQEVMQILKEFRDERNWLQFHNPKDLAMAITVEAAELQEIFLWKHFNEIKKFSQENKEVIKYELADILTYLLFLCDIMEIDPLDTVIEKLEISKKKYPKQKSTGVSSNKYQ